MYISDNSNIFASFIQCTPELNVLFRQSSNHTIIKILENRFRADTYLLHIVCHTKLHNIHILHNLILTARHTHIHTRNMHQLCRRRHTKHIFRFLAYDSGHTSKHTYIPNGTHKQSRYAIVQLKTSTKIKSAPYRTYYIL